MMSECTHLRDSIISIKQYMPYNSTTVPNKLKRDLNFVLLYCIAR